MEDEVYVVKSRTPIERQRDEDGTPFTSSRPGFKPADPELYLSKGSLAEKLGKAPTPAKADPPVYDAKALAELVKSYLNS
jgi:hypothetical protein